MTTSAPEAIHGELRAAVGHGCPVPPGYVRISEKRHGYQGETPLNEYLPQPRFTGLYADVALEATRRNAGFMPFQSPEGDEGEPLIPLRFYPHPAPKPID